MSKGRLEAFSDGVIAILITIMVLELKVPHGGDPASLRPVLPVFLTYVLSYVFLGIYNLADQRAQEPVSGSFASQVMPQNGRTLLFDLTGAFQ